MACAQASASTQNKKLPRPGFADDGVAAPFKQLVVIKAVGGMGAEIRRQGQADPRALPGRFIENGDPRHGGREDPDLRRILIVRKINLEQARIRVRHGIAP